MQSKNKNKNGFTLIEFLVAIAIFSLLVSSAVFILSSTLKSQRKALALQQISDQTSYMLEYMSRTIRMAQPGTIKSAAGGVEFESYNGETVKFFYEDGAIKQFKSGEAINLTSEDIEVTSAYFSITGIDTGDGLQPKVTIAITITSEGSKPEEQTEIRVQTTISQRNLD